MRFAYADPPYLGCCGLYDHYHPDGKCWNLIGTHQFLVEDLTRHYPDGWALSCSSTSLQRILPLCPDDVRVCAWVKPFAAFKPNVNPAYAWEPVIVRGGRKRDRYEPTVRDWLAESITLKRGLTGAKPEAFCAWVLDLLGARAEDTVIDLFPGTGVMGRVFAARRGVASSDQLQLEGS